MATNNPPSPNSNKRKRNSEHDGGRAMKSPSATNGDEATQQQMFQSLLQGISDTIPSQDETSRTAQAALQQQQSSYPEPNVFDHAVASGFDDPSAGLPHSVPQHQMSPGGQGIFDARQSAQNKPPVGSQAWHQQRKDNHKEVERRRREVINEGIENIAKMIPSQDKNKGAVLQNACRYIQELQAKIANFEQERNVFEITQSEITRRNASLRDSAQRAWEETAKWMGRCKEAGLQFEDYDATVTAENLEESANNNLGGAGDASDFNVGEKKSGDNLS